MTSEGGQSPALDTPNEITPEPAGGGPTPLDDAAAAISGVMPGAAPALEDVPVRRDDETGDPEEFEPPLMR
ncbi:MAG TPA: hypothetical protein VFK38_04370 [Candidatus Limnocylindrales bacterium]|nr:hypothetical protein [Candidatus Limnocylindrales bacterium]